MNITAYWTEFVLSHHPKVFTFMYVIFYEVFTDTAAVPHCHPLLVRHAPASPTVMALNSTFYGSCYVKLCYVMLGLVKQFELSYKACMQTGAKRFLKHRKKSYSRL